MGGGYLDASPWPTRLCHTPQLMLAMAWGGQITWAGWVSAEPARSLVDRKKFCTGPCQQLYCLLAISGLSALGLNDKASATGRLYA